MTFTAKIIRRSAVWRLWRDQARVGGIVHDVRFHFAPPCDYVSGELSGDQVTILKSHPCIVLEAIGRAEPTVEEAVAPLAEPEEAAEPIAAPTEAPRFVFHAEPEQTTVPALEHPTAPPVPGTPRSWEEAVQMQRAKRKRTGQ